MHLLQCFFSAFFLFVVSVNMFPKFALACEKIPALEELVQVVCFSETMRTALENKYYQEVDYKKTQNGITLEIKYLIADEKSVCVFYKIDSKDKMMPEKMQLSGEIKSSQKNEPVTKMSAEIQIDQSKIAPSKEVTMNHQFEIGQEKYKIEKAVMSPLSFQIKIAEESGNTKQLSSLDFYVQDENGRKYQLNRMEGSKKGSRISYYTGSPYFNKIKELTMVIEGATFSNGEKSEVAVDLLNKKASNLPDFVKLVGIIHENQSINALFEVQNSSLSHEQFLPDEYKDETRKEYPANSIERLYKEDEGRVVEILKLPENTSDKIYFQPMYSSILKLNQPLQIRIKIVK